MSLKLLVLTTTMVSIVHLQIMDEHFWEKGDKKCNTISYNQEEFTFVKKDPAIKLHPDCVNDKILEKDGKKFCISGNGDDELKCKSESEGMMRAKSVFRQKVWSSQK